MEPFITTYTGIKVNPLNLRPSDIRVMDIAHHLAAQNRWVGALKRPVNIALHSVYVARLVEGTGWELEALFHDATEAYLGDVSKWVKRSDTMAAYREAEERAWEVICVALGLRVNLPRCVEAADSLMVRFEAMMLLRNPKHLFEVSTHPRPTPEEIARIGEWSPLSWRRSKDLFLEEYERHLANTGVKHASR